MKRIMLTLEVMNPLAEIPKVQSAGALSPRLPNLEGKKLALILNGKPGTVLMADDFEHMIKAKFPSTSVTRYPTPQVAHKEFAKNKPDAFIHLMGD
jgi:hypothetical protein